jgi:hypothetical protein
MPEWYSGRYNASVVYLPPLFPCLLSLFPVSVFCASALFPCLLALFSCFLSLMSCLLSLIACLLTLLPCFLSLFSSLPVPASSPPVPSYLVSCSSSALFLLFPLTLPLPHPSSVATLFYLLASCHSF